MSNAYSISNTATIKIKSSIERAFKTPILGDATQILTGYWCIPPVSGFINDETWGEDGGSRIPLSNGNWLSKGGSQGLDEIITRQENKYWKWQISEFGSSLFFAKKAEGEWWCSEASNGEVSVIWKYTWYPKNVFFYPITWLFVRILWRGVMKQGIAKIKAMAENNAAYIYNK